MISEELSALLRRSLAYGDSSGGAFDVSIGPLSHLWDFLAAHPHVPPAARIAERRRLVDYRRISLHGRTLFLPLRGMILDLGAIGKGYAADRAIDVLSRHHVARAIVDLGGNLAVRWSGTHGLDSTVARISVRHPRHDGKFLGSFMCGAAGISTSGDYQRCFLEGGKRYHHILDPVTGYPASELVSVTIVDSNGTDADALSTLVFVLGRRRGMEFIRKSKGVEGILVYEQGDSLGIDLSPGLVGKFERTDD
jgi:thiamine biosynthesis lipoprotein